MGNSFGAYYKELRRNKTDLSLRKFCEQHGFDPGNISKLERGVNPPPKDREILEGYAQALSIKEGTDEWYRFFDKAAADRGEFPPDLRDNEELAEKLPVFFRTLREGEFSGEDFEEILKIVRQ